MFNTFNVYCDAPQPWGVYFQDSATPQMEALIELHDNIMFYLVIILFGVAWILLSIVRNYVQNKSPISNKYLNHGKCVPAQKLFNKKCLLYHKRYYSTSSNNGFNLSPINTYSNAYTMKNLIISDNKGKAGIYICLQIRSRETYT